LKEARRERRALGCFAPSFRLRNPDTEKLAREATNEFERLFYCHTGRPIHKRHTSLEAYDRHINLLVDQRRRRGETAPLRWLEIGVKWGGSLELWRKRLGPDAIIYGIDVDPGCAALSLPDLPVRIGSQDDHEFLQSVVDEMGGVDVVVDDGSHKARHQAASFEFLFPRLSPYGLYICEDIHTSYWPGHEGGLKRPGTFVEFTKQMIDWLHDWYIHPDERNEQTDIHGFASGVLGISVYDGIVFIEKRPRGRPFHVTVGSKRQKNVSGEATTADEPPIE
jgi:hypothetical protein